MRATWYHGLIATLVFAPAAPAQTVSQKPPGGPEQALPPAPAIAFKVAVWYRRDRPLDTFQYQIYDLRKGEYTQAVDDWVALLQTRFPAYEVRVRPVDLNRQKGSTEKLKVGSVIQQELWGAAALQGVFLGAPMANPLSPLSPRASLAPAPELSRRPTLPGLMSSPRVDFGPPRPSFPVPMPYPRPHP